MSNTVEMCVLPRKSLTPCTRVWKRMDIPKRCDGCGMNRGGGVSGIAIKPRDPANSALDKMAIDRGDRVRSYIDKARDITRTNKSS